MKLTKAIEINDLLAKRLLHISQVDEQTAVNLGIKALKECMKARYGDPALDGELLPGETPE